MSLTAMRPPRLSCSSVMQRVSVPVSRMRLQAANRLMPASMPSCFWTSQSLIWGVTVVMSSGSAKPKCLSAKAVSRLTEPARRAS